MKIITSNRFKRSYKKFVHNYPYLQNNIDEVITQLSENPFKENLATHKLSGDLYELYASKCGYNCRILFSIEILPQKDEKIIVLVDIGTHEDVY
jgi:mRNA interferase YafQ